MTRRRLFRIRAQYAATAVTMLVWGDDWDEAHHRAQWYQKGAIAYCFAGELDPDDPQGKAAI